MSPRTATTTAPLHPLLADRWSPRAFDPAPVDDDALRSLLEAARWAPSAMNHQPWRFLVGRSGRDGADAAHKAIFDSLAEGNQVWASAAPVLVAAVARVREENGAERTVAPFELGLAVSQLITQAHALGLHAHVVGGFDRDAVTASFGVPADHRVYAVLAIGRLGDPESLPAPLAAREAAPRERLPLEQIAYGEAWGAPAL